MSWLRRTVLRLVRSVRRTDFEREMDDEMRFHLEEEMADRERRGLTVAEARRTALRDFGPLAAQKEDARAARRVAWLDDFALDLRFALRGLRRSVGSSLAAVVTLALGVGATTATVSVVNGVILRPLPYVEPSRVAAVWEKNLARQRWANSVAVSNFEAMVTRNRTFTALAALVPDQQVLEHGRPDRIRGAAVSAEWFSVTGVRPALGRAFTELEASSEARVMVLSNDFWRDDFGADSSVIGRMISFQDQRFTVVGVMPPGFTPPSMAWLSTDQRYWIPFAPTPANRPWGRSLLVIGRLRPDISIVQAEGDLASIMAQRGREDPDANSGWSATVKSFHQELVGAVRTPLLVLSVAVMGLLAITIVNLMAITLSRMRRRAPELAMRIALGAGRGRLVRQALSEAVALALVAAPLAALIAFAAVRGLHAAHPVNLPRVDNVRLDLAAVSIGLGLALFATIIATVVPAIQLARRDLRDVIGSGGRTTRRSFGGRLVVAEIAVALVLTVAAALAMRSFVNLLSTDLGFGVDRVTAFRVSLPPTRYDAIQARFFFQNLTAGLERIPGVARAGLVSVRPLGGTLVATSVFPADRTVEKKDAPVADIRVASAGYFQTIDIRWVAGFYPEAVTGAELPIVITQSLARALWPDRDPIGNEALINLNDGIRARVAGLVNDARLNGPATNSRPIVYLPAEGAADRELDVLLRTTGSIDGLTGRIEDVVRSLDSSVPIYQIASLDGMMRDALATDRITFVLLAGFSLVAVTLAAAGVAGVLLVEVGHRRRELGVRIALGAGRGAVRARVLQAGAKLAISGILIGSGGAFLLTRFMQSLLHGVSPTDPATYLIVALALLGVSLGATYLPAHRATRVDPLEVLRSE